MRTNELSYAPVKYALELALNGAGSNAALARKADVSDEFVRQCAAGERPISGKLLDFLGYERVIVYRALP